MLAGVNANDLEALLEFVYRGEVSVDHSQLPSLLQAAHCLNIQGLAPQTVSHKDDNTTYTTSIQLHPTLVPQHQAVKAVIDVGNNVCVSNLDFQREKGCFPVADLQQLWQFLISDLKIIASPKLLLHS